MKIRRLKHVRRTLTFYKTNFGLSPPYFVMLDGTFCRAALKCKVNIMEQLPKYFDAEVKLCTTNCALKECEALGPLLYGPYKVLQQYMQVPCGHSTTLPANVCLHRLAAKQKKRREKYFFGTQDPELSEGIRKLPGVPLIFISHHAITLETPSDKSKRKASGLLQDRLAPSTVEQERLNELKKEAFGEEEPKKRKKRKGPKGANPLSCKKKKKNQNQIHVTTELSAVTKRKRHRKRHRIHVPEHVKAHIAQVKKT